MRTGILGRAASHVANARDFKRLKSEDPLKRERATARLIKRLGQMRGLPHKFAQIMASSQHASAASLDALTIGGDELPWSEIEDVLTLSWGQGWADHFAEFSKEGLPASLGQVHRARLNDGREVAVKVKYPGIANALRSDLALMDVVRLAGDANAPARAWERMRDDLVRQLEEELDYRHEARRTKDFGRLSESIPGLIVPGVVDAWSGDDVLVTLWEEGDLLSDAAEWSRDDRRRAAQIYLDAFLGSFLGAGQVHADPHPGNYRFRRGAQGRVEMVLYDFGSTLDLEDSTRLHFAALLVGAAQRRGDPLHILAQLGFDADMLLPIRENLPAVCSVLFEPFSQCGVYDHTTWNRQERMRQVLGDQSWNLRLAAPPSVLPLMRAFQGLIHCVASLDTPLSWRKTLDAVCRADQGRIRAILERTHPVPVSYAMLATELRVQVAKRGGSDVRITLPAVAIERLEELMDGSVRAAVEKSGVDLAEVVQSVRAQGYAPMTLIECEDDERSIRVWLS